MSSKPDTVLETMVKYYEENTAAGKTTAAGVNGIVTALMNANPEDRVEIMESFESKAKELANA